MAESEDLVTLDAAVDRIVSSGSSGRDSRLIKVAMMSEVRIRYLRDMPRHIDKVDPVLRAKLRACTEGTEPWPVYLFGSHGAGKTMAALCMVDRVHTALYTEVADWCDRLEQARARDSGVLSQWDIVSDAALTVLDELGARDKPSPARWEAVFRFASRREWKPAIYLSNLDPKEFRTQYGERIYDRVMCGTVIELSGPSRR